MLLSFRSAGLDTILASSGADALQVLDASQVEAVVIDPDLPDDLGRLVLDRLGETSKPRRKPLHWVVMSALDIQQPGFNLFISGPPGTGRNTALRTHLEHVAAGKDIPPDWG